jgi:uncharacterized membrane protein YhaH (DUF805 family)
MLVFVIALIIGQIFYILLLLVPLLGGLALAIKERHERGYTFWLGIILLVIFVILIGFEPTRHLYSDALQGLIKFTAYQ